MARTLDATAAINAANKVTERNTLPERTENEKTKFVNIRMKETDHKRIGILAVNAGITKADFCKRAALWIADMVEAGAFTINSGNVLDRRGL